MILKIGRAEANRNNESLERESESGSSWKMTRDFELQIQRRLKI